jgi:hypothetical protein
MRLQLKLILLVNLIYLNKITIMEAASMSSRIAPAPVDIKKLVNKIFAQKGHPEVKNFPKEFSDGSNLYTL